MSSADGKAAQRESIESTLRRFRLIPLARPVVDHYAVLRREYPRLEKEDALIAATAVVKRVPLMTGNWRHFRQIDGLTLYAGR